MPPDAVAALPLKVYPADGEATTSTVPEKSNPVESGIELSEFDVAAGIKIRKNPFATAEAVLKVMTCWGRDLKTIVSVESSASAGSKFVVSVNSSASMMEAMVYVFVPPMVSKSPTLRPAVETEYSSGVLAV